MVRHWLERLGKGEGASSLFARAVLGQDSVKTSCCLNSPGLLTQVSL